jgi:DNA-binding MarR family transcriptional regulator
MGRALQERLASRKFEGPHHEALLNVIVTASHLRGLLDEVFEGDGLTPGQYNVLRILNGAFPEGYPRGEIAHRMMDRAPDLTRMIDRLVSRGYVQRARATADARQSIASITPKGRKLLASLHGRVRAVTRQLEARLSVRESRELSRLCEKLYGPLD